LDKVELIAPEIFRDLQKGLAFEYSCTGDKIKDNLTLYPRQTKIIAFSIEAGRES
jgi:hypothetical protein